MKYVATKWNRATRIFGHIGIYFGFLGMIVIIALVFYSNYNVLIKEPDTIVASPVIPGLPIAGTGLVFPLLTGWLAIFIIIVVHEFSHGIVSKAHKVPIKHSGIAFFGPLLGAFVEPDQKKLNKQKDSVQHGVFAAGSFSNMLLTVVAIAMIFGIIFPIASLFVTSTGVIISPQIGKPAESAGIENLTTIISMNNVPISTIKDFQRVMDSVQPSDTISLRSENNSYAITTIQNPDDSSKAYLGVWVHGTARQLKSESLFGKVAFSVLEWINELIRWVAFLSISIGLINLLPIFITDGAQMLRVFFARVFKDKKQGLKFWFWVNWIFLASLLIMLLPLFRKLFAFLFNIGA